MNNTRLEGARSLWTFTSRVAATGQGHAGHLAHEYLPGVVTVRSSVRVKVLMVATQQLPATSSTSVGVARPCAGLPFHSGFSQVT